MATKKKATKQPPPKCTCGTEGKGFHAGKPYLPKHHAVSCPVRIVGTLDVPKCRCGSQAWESRAATEPGKRAVAVKCADCLRHFTAKEREARDAWGEVAYPAPDTSPPKSTWSPHKHPGPGADGRYKARDDEERKQVTAIATKLVIGMVEKGEVDPDDEAQVRAAMAKAVPLAFEAYRAAVDFIFR